MLGTKVGEPAWGLVSHWPPLGTNWFVMSRDLRSHVKCFSETTAHPEGQSEERQLRAGLTLGPSCWEWSGDELGRYTAEGPRWQSKVPSAAKGEGTRTLLTMDGCHKLQMVLRNMKKVGVPCAMMSQPARHWQQR